MGRVYLAQHVRLPQQAAIKVLNAGMLSDPDAVARFNREAANAARIEHDRVARVFDFGETREGSVYIAMEYVPGRSLHAVVEDAGRLPPVRAAQITYQVAEGLAAAHAIGIVHRDLKPDNIMVVSEPQGADRCKVVDFGIAKAADAANTTRITRTGTVVGTPEYMSPEQFLGEDLDSRSDVYSLALVAYNAFTGVLPFTATTPERAMAARMIDDPRSLSAAVPDVEWPAALQHAFDRALDRDPSTRTATTMEFADAVVSAVEEWTGESVLRARTPLSPRRVTPSTVPLVSGSPTATTKTAATSIPPVATVADSGRKTSGPLLVGVGVVVLSVVGYFAFARKDVPPPPASVVADSAASASVAPGTAVPETKAKSAPLPAASVGTLPREESADPAPPAASQPVAASIETPPETRRTLDSVNAVLADDASGASEAQAAVKVLDQLLKSMATRTDSTWTYLALVSAHGQAGVAPTRACSALRNADRLATSPAQRTAIANWFATEALACVR
jgi:serine/threonine-protein kinase